MARCCVALYDLAPVHANTLGIREGEKLLIVDIKNNDPHWWYAINRKGHIGYVPRTYVGFLDVRERNLLMTSETPPLINIVLFIVIYP